MCGDAYKLKCKYTVDDLSQATLVHDWNGFSGEGSVDTIGTRGKESRQRNGNNAHSASSIALIAGRSIVCIRMCTYGMYVMYVCTIRWMRVHVCLCIHMYIDGQTLLRSGAFVRPKW